MTRARTAALAVLALALLALAVMAPAPARAQAGDDLALCAERIVTSTRLVGCDAGCASREPLQRLLALVPIGAPLPVPDAERLRHRLDEARLARASQLACEPSGDDASLVLTVEPMTFVRRVKITGNDAFRRKDILKRVFLRAGTPLPLDPAHPLDDEQLRRQVESLERLYRQAGLDDARIEVRVTHVDPSHLDLELVIHEGQRTRLDEVLATHRHRGAPDPDGLTCPTIDERRLERLVGLGVGDIWTRIVERQLKERLRQAFQSAGFVRPRITVTPPVGDRGTLDVQVETDQCWLVRLWRRDAARHASDDDLSFRWQDPIHGPITRDSAPWARVPLADWSGVLPFGESGSFEREEAVRGIGALAAELRARGFPFAEVDLEHRDLTRRPERRARSSEVLGTIDYFISNNLERRLQAVRFVGRAALAEADLLALMKTRPYDFFGGSGAFDQARVEADLAAIEAHYRERGFSAFRFVPPLERPGFVLYRYGDDALPFALEKHPSSPHLNLVIAFEEGPQARLGTFRLSGVTVVPVAQLEALTGLGPNRGFGPAPLREALERLARFYRVRGHHRMTLDPKCSSAGAPRPCDTSESASPAGASQPSTPAPQAPIDLELVIDEGPVVRVGAVVWRGNAETDPHVLVRDLPHPGDILDFDRINRAVRKMRALGIFNSVRVDTEGLDDPEPRDVVLVVTVEESQVRFLDVALGVRSIQRANIGRVPAWAASGAGVLVDQGDRLTTGFGRAFALDIPDLLLTFDFEYLDLNAFGVGNQLRIPFDAGFSLSQFLRLASFNPSYTFPRIFDTDLLLTARGIAELDRVTDPLDRLELGLEGELLIPLADTMSAGLSARAGIIQLQSPAADCVYCLSGPPLGAGSALPQEAAEAAADAVACDADPNLPGCSDLGFRPQFTVGARWRWDTQDTPLHPTRGVAVAASTSFILDRDRLSSAPVFNQFLKWEASLRAALSVQSLVLATFVRYGGAATFDELFLPPDERFTLGGSNGVRGFADNGICRYDRDGELEATCMTEFGGNVVVQGSLELRAPLVPSIGLWLGTFLDVGGLARTHSELHLASLRLSSGFGVRWLLGGLFPIRLDVGFPLLERRCVSLREDGSCVLEEPSQVHFGLLYTF